jgi:hypothetical protein
MAVLGYLKLESRPGPLGLRVPAEDAVAAEAVRLVRAMVESRPASPAYLRNFAGTWPTDPDLTLGPLDEGVAWSQVARLLAEPPAPRTPWGVEWSIRGCEIQTENWANDDSDTIVALNFRLHGDVDSVARALEGALGTALSAEEDDDREYDLRTSGVSLSMFEYSPDEHDGLFGEAATEGADAWLRTRIAEGPGLWDFLYPSSPLLRPSSGGFLEFFASTCALMRGPGLLIRAIRDHGIGGLRRWFVVRWAIPIGQCALPPRVVAGSRADVLSFLHDPASLDAGSVTMETWSGAVAYEWKHRRRVGWRRVWGPGYVDTVESDTFATKIGRRRVRVRKFLSPATGLADSGWVELTLGR